MNGGRSQVVRFLGAAARLAVVIVPLAWVLARAQTLPPDQTEIRTRVAEAVQVAASDLGVFVDPGVTEEISKTVDVFAGNFCFPAHHPPSVARCERTVRQRGVLVGAVRDYLESAWARRPPAMLSVGARMAEREGLSFAQIGWPPEVPNRVAVIEFSRTPAGRVALRTASGPAPLGSSRRYVLTTPGFQEFEVTEGTGRSVVRVNTAAARVTRAELDGNSGSTIAAPLRIDPPVSRYCVGGSQPPASGALAFFNWARATYVEPDETKRANLAPIARQPAIEVSVRDDAGICGDACRAGVATAFVQSIALWRGGCSRCDQNAMSVVKVNQDVWIDARLASRLRGDVTSLDLNRTVPSETAIAVTAPAISVPTSAMYGYEPVVTGEDIERRLCSSNIASSGGPIAEVRQVVCNRRSPAGGVRATVVFRSRTSCGPAADFIACGRPLAEVELATDDTRYRVATTDGTRLAGAGADEPIELRDVILHEVGHWFGVPHLDEAAPGAGVDIMSGTYTQGRACISGASLVMLNNAADLRWPFRVTEGRGLRRAPASASQRTAVPAAPALPVPVAPPVPRPPPGYSR
ncbi:hypothetical protein H8N03_01135 [Ramlibacter sp. USB13]|uniref:Matrixin family metalloprotease n=1 Tax=Ramlibacter cellulosilyticus TaxID=2764187 RepID=A0A923S9C3_9BURK|nr:hypothetical protein [Ramlibacter cellulosilyticus]MBC5781526.1 hypothetical protein [Ramlibacter cellulosilyticus]